MVKATQAMTELKGKKLQIINLYSIIEDKDKAFQILLEAQKLNREVNIKNEQIIEAQKIKQNKCDEYNLSLEKANKKLTFKKGFLEIGTPVIAVGFSAIGFIGGFYIAKALK